MSEVIQTMAPTVPPRAFISYSWTSKEYCERIHELAERLVNDGVDVILDVWDLKEGDDKHAYMERAVTDPSVNHVLCFCDKRYAEKADGREGGVGTEAQIITPGLYGKVNQDKFLPIVMERFEGKEFLPAFLSSRLYFDLSDGAKYEDEFEKLLRRIHKRPAKSRPALGQPPAYLEASNRFRVPATSTFLRFRSALQAGMPHSIGSAAEYLADFTDSLKRLIVQGEKQENPRDEVLLQKINEYMGSSDEFLEFVWLLLEYGQLTHNITRIRDVFEKSLELWNTGEERMIPLGWQKEALDFVIRNLFLSVCSMLISREKYSDFQVLVDHRYLLMKRGRDTLVPYGVFDDFLESLEKRSDRLELRRLSIVADQINRVVNKHTPFRDLMQADFILCLRLALHTHTSQAGHRWFPRSLVYTEDWHQPFPMFMRADDKKGFGVLRILLNVESKAQLQELFERACKVHRLREYGWGSGSSVDWELLSNLSALDSR